MKKITQKELDKRIELHQEWLKDSSKGEKLTLRNCDLSNISLAEIDLRYADLMFSDLSHTIIVNCNLEDAILYGTNLYKADLNYCNLGMANLCRTDLSYARLFDTDLSDVLLCSSNLKHTDLRYANLYNTNLGNCNLENTYLTQANTNQVRGLEIYSIDNIGTFHGKVTYVPSIDTVYAGCWSGTLEQFLEKGLEMNKGNKQETKNIKLAYQFFKNNSK